MTAIKNSQNTGKRRGCLFNLTSSFSLVTGVIGLIVDSVALFGIVIAIFNGTSENQVINQDVLPSVPGFIVLVLVLFYSWFMISWYFARRHFQTIKSNKTTKSEKAKQWKKSLNPITFSIGFLMLPLWVICLVIGSFFVVDFTETTIDLYIFGFCGISFFIALIIIPAIVFSIEGIFLTLMPIIYPDMEIINITDNVY